MTINPKKRLKLKDLAEKLLDVYLNEADPDTWVNEESAREKYEELVSRGVSPTEAAKQTGSWKGDRYWEKKNANQTMTMLIQIGRFLDQGAADDPEETAALEKEIRKAEKQAKQRLARTRPKLVASNGKKR